jgi:hypothetical protein
MRVSRAVHTVISGNKSWVKGLLSLFAKASATAQQNIVSAASLTELATDCFINDRTIPAEAVPGFLDAMLEYEKLLRPTDSARLGVELTAAVEILAELQKEIAAKKADLTMVKRALNAAKKELAYLRADAEKSGTLTMLEIARALDMLPTEAIRRLTKEKAPEVTDGWYENLPKKLTAENLRTSWEAIDIAEREAICDFVCDPTDARKLLVFAAAVCLFGEEMTDQQQEAHVNFLTSSEEYAQTYDTLEQEYARL